MQLSGITSVMTDTAVLVVDMLNDYRHTDAEQLTDLVERSRATEDIDRIYVNDNDGDFTAGFAEIAGSALHGAGPELVRPVAPVVGDRTVTKVRHSAFYSTPLEYLLGRLGTQPLILTGQVTEQCILYTALDTDVRHLPVPIPVDAVAHIEPDWAPRRWRDVPQYGCRTVDCRMPTLPASELPCAPSAR